MTAHRLGKFVIERRRSGRLRVTLYASNGRVLLVSDDYESKRAALALVEAVRRVAADARFEDRTEPGAAPDMSPTKRPVKRAGSAELAASETSAPPSTRSVGSRSKAGKSPSTRTRKQATSSAPSAPAQTSTSKTPAKATKGARGAKGTGGAVRPSKRRR